MDQHRKNFITINEEFTCETCGFFVPAARATCRNHCTQCLASKHVDDRIPGDRASSCKAIMKAIDVKGSDPEKLVIIHACTACGKIQRNKSALDDSQDALFELMRNK